MNKIIMSSTSIPPPITKHILITTTILIIPNISNTLNISNTSNTSNTLNTLNISNTLNTSNTPNTSNTQLQQRTFLTFGGPTINFHNRVNVLCNQVKSLKFFHTIHGLDERFLQTDLEFWNQHGSFMNKNPRGYGFWLWKPYVIKKTLEKMNDNDILVYCDAGCMFNPQGMTRMNQYIDMININSTRDYGILCFSLNHPEIKYTKRAVFEYFNASRESVYQSQYMATVIIIKKNCHSTKVINEWYDVASCYKLINDDKQFGIESPLFLDHRHDQSIFSMLIKKHGAVSLQDETFFHPNWQNGINYPIWAKRIRS